MKRREFITLLGGAAAWPIAARAQQPERMRRIGILLGLAENDLMVQSRMLAFRKGLRDLGWVEGRNVQIDYRFAGGDSDRAMTYAAELVKLAPDVFLANGTPVIVALRQATTSIPIVFAVLNDPVGQGFISSLARPGGNITGFTLIEFTMVGKWLEMLKAMSPDIVRASLMFNPQTSPYYDVYLRSFETLQRSIAVEVTAAPIRDVAEIEPAIAKLGRRRETGMIVPPDTFTVVHRETIMRSAEEHRLPVIWPYRQFVAEGGLISYGPDTIDIFRRSASYVDRILKGEKPADLPAQSPITFELAINLKTARTLGLAVPPSLLAIADEVIE
jgi:putative tryptophan/tyrosine transport system substrate-binding protein